MRVFREMMGYHNFAPNDLPRKNLLQVPTRAYLTVTTTSYRILFVGSCADKNAMTTMRINQ